MVDTHAKTQPKKVRLVAIRKYILDKGEEINAYNGKIYFEGTDEFLVFTCTSRGNAPSIYKSSDFITQSSGYNSYNGKIGYAEIAIPGIHEKRPPGKSSSREFTTALPIVAADETILKNKFPNAEIIIVNSVDELKKAYAESIAHNKQIIDADNKALEERLLLLQRTYDEKRAAERKAAKEEAVKKKAAEEIAREEAAERKAAERKAVAKAVQARKERVAELRKTQRNTNPFGRG